MKPVCINCRNPARTVNRPRGLCWTCYYTPDVSALYPSTDKRGQRGFLCTNTTPPLSPKATQARPGSTEKKQVMRRRAKLGFAVFHPRDARM